MSYLNLPKGIPEFSKAVISLWFRVPKQSIDAALAVELPPAFTFILQRTIPLVTFGKPQTQKRYERNMVDVAHYHYTPVHGFKPALDSPTYSVTAEDELSPCYIGIECDDNRAVLAFNIQMADHASISNLQFNRSSVDIYSPDPPPPPGASSDPGSGWSQFADPIAPCFTILVDTSFTYDAQPEFFYVSTDHKIEPDQWHHLLLSFDLSTPCNTHGPPQTMDPFGSFHETTAQGTDSYCRLWYAIDDVDYRGPDNLNPYSVDGGPDPNAILTQNAYLAANSVTSLPSNVAIAPANCTYIPEPIPSDQAEMGLPASAKWLDHILRVEMAEFQIWTGVTLDTGIKSNRRAFVDADGLPVNPEGTEDDPAPAAKLLGKRPDILLHGSNNWADGYNTGSVGIRIETIDGQETITKLPDGQFKPIAKIEPYKPDPSLEETTA